MKPRVAWVVIAIVTTLVITGCETSTHKVSDPPPAAQPGQGTVEPDKSPRDPSTGQTAEKPPAQPITALAISSAEAPAALRDWAATQTNAQQPSSKSVTEGNATYLAITGGLQPSGGYTVEVTEVSPQGDGWEVRARVVPPAKGSIVTEALTNPVGYFKLPKVSGGISVTVTAPAAPSTGPAPAPPGPGEVASANFRIKSVRRTAADTVTVEGWARAFEAVFLVEIRAGEMVLAHVAVKADAGAPAFGHFQQAIKVPGGVPAGAEAWFLIESAKDGSTTAELSVPVTTP